MTAGMATLYGVGLIVLGAFVLCVAAYLWCSLPGWFRELRDAFNEGKTRGEADADRLMGKHRDDCGCDACWDRYQERLVRDYDWTAAEHDIAWRRP